MGFEAYFRFFIAFAFTIGLIGAVYWLARRYADRFGIMRASGAGRLRVSGQLSLDPRRRIVLLRRDDREHLLLLGPNNDLLLESGIAGGQDDFAAALHAASPASAPAPSSSPASPPASPPTPAPAPETTLPGSSLIQGEKS